MHLGAESQSEGTIQLVSKPWKMVLQISRRRRGTKEGVTVAKWCSEWMCSMRGGLILHTMIIPVALYLPLLQGAAVGRASAPTIFQNNWFCTRISNFSQSPIFSIARVPTLCTDLGRTDCLLHFDPQNIYKIPQNSYGKIRNQRSAFVSRSSAQTLTQGARSTSNENAEIPQWAVGCRNRWIPRIPQILPESRSREIQRWAIICGIKFSVLKISNHFDTNLPSQKSCVLCQGRFVSKLFDIFKTENLVPHIIAQRWISLLRDSGRICGILGIRRFRHPTAHCGIPAFSFEVDRVPCDHRFVASKSRWQYYRRIVSFP